MRRTLALPVVLAIGVVIVACEKPAPDAKPPALPLASPPTGPLALLASLIDTTMTLGSWMRGHPGDVVQDSVPVGALTVHTCRIAVAPLRVGGHDLVRQALFGVPNPPNGEMLPDTVRLAEEQCHLRAIWLVTTAPDSARSLVFADSLATMLDALLGHSQPGVSLREPRTSSWLGARSWHGPGTTVVLGVLKAERSWRDRIEVTDDAEREGRVIIASIAPNSGLDSPVGNTPSMETEREGERVLELMQADSALDWAALPAVTAEVRPLFSELETRRAFDSLHMLAFDSALAHVTSAVRERGPSLAPSRRAALLFVGDVMFDRAVHERGLRTDLDDSLLNVLKAAGAPANFLERDDLGFFPRPWLVDAYHYDSLGPAGHAALVARLARGWNSNLECDARLTQIDSVIAHGNAALKRGETDPNVHYYLGLANYDLFIVANDRDAHYFGRAPNKPPFLRSRERALEHFRAALAGSLDPRMRRHAWRIAMAAMLGHSLGARYFCAQGD